MVRYKVKPDRVAENEALVRAVYDELAGADPAGLRYATYRLEDGVSFVHIAAFETGVEGNPLTGTAAFRRFRDALEERCEEPPVREVLHELRSFDASAPS
jgi:hypothetical protein